MSPLLSVVVVNVSLIALFSPPAAWYTSKFERSCIPLMVTLNNREPAELKYGSEKSSLTV